MSLARGGVLRWVAPLILALIAVGPGVARTQAECDPIELGVLTQSLQFDGELDNGDCADPLDPGDLADIFSFRLEASTTVAIDAQAPRFHAQFRLFRGSEELIRTVSSSVFGGSAFMEIDLAPDGYRIVATEYTIGQVSGGYRLRIGIANQEDDHEDDHKHDHEDEGGPRYVYPIGEPSYAAPPDWLHYGRQTHTRCSGARNEILKRDAIAARLFNHDSLLFDRLLLPPTHINHSYNCHGAHPQIGWTGYEGGHSGWDVQSHNVIGRKTADDIFYSLTNGTVAYAGGGYGAVVIHTDDGHTVWYQHARRIYTVVGAEVRVGTPLGVQGNVGMGFDDETIGEHIHIAVRVGRHTMPPPTGALETIDPVAYFHRYLYE